MIRKHESSVSWKAGALAVAVHVVLLAALLISFNWKAAHNVLNATEVDLWDKLPAQNAPNPAPIVQPKPEPVVKEAPKEEEKKLEAQKQEEQQKQEEKEAEIAFKKREEERAEKERLQKDKELEEKRKKDEDKKKLLAAMREDTLQEKPKKKDNDSAKNLAEKFLNEDKGESDKKAAAANASLIGEYTAKIRAKIRGNVNKTLCPDGNPELRFEIGLLPTGELTGTPKITKSSGNTACDDAVERAIRASEPLPLPSDPNLFSSFRNLNLKFRPND